MRERVQKIMARAGIGSRRHNEHLIATGRVHINDQVARLGDKADPNLDKVTVDGREIKRASLVYIKLNKPRGVLSSLHDEQDKNRPTIRDLVDVPGHLYPVGRLDKQSEGLILMTNDGELAHRLTHPRYEHEKTYRVKVEGDISESTLNQWGSGLYLDDRRTLPAKIDRLSNAANHTWLRITMREGRKRQIRRVGALLGHPVLQLIRERIGPVELGHLGYGQWSHLTESEISQLRRLVDNS